MRPIAVIQELLMWLGAEVSELKPFDGKEVRVGAGGVR